MKKVTCKIKGCNGFGEEKDMVQEVSHSNSYDVGYQLCHTLKLYERKLCNCENIIIYPLAWGEDFFEIMFRDKNYVNDPKCKVFVGEVINLVNSYLDKDWVLCDDLLESVSDDGINPPCFFKFIRCEE